MTELRAEITRRLRDAGHPSVTDFANTWAYRPLTELARMLGGVSAVQLEMCLREEARETHEMVAFAKSHLVRCLREMLPLGWGVGGDFDFKRASAYARWAVGLGEEAHADAETAFHRLKALKPPTGWSPTNTEDPLIAAACRGLAFGPSDGSGHP